MQQSNLPLNAPEVELVRSGSKVLALEGNPGEIF
jgi:hypothetical protein